MTAHARVGRDFKAWAEREDAAADCQLAAHLGASRAELHSCGDVKARMVGRSVRMDRPTLWCGARSGRVSGLVATLLCAGKHDGADSRKEAQEQRGAGGGLLRRRLAVGDGGIS